MNCPRRYVLRGSHKVERETSGEALDSMKLICDEAWFTNCSSVRRRGLSLCACPRVLLCLLCACVRIYMIGSASVI